MRRRAMRGGLGCVAGALDVWERRKLFHAEAAGTMRVFKHRRADAVFSGDGFEAGDGNVEARRLGRLRREETKLHLARLARLGGECEREHGGRRRMGSDLQLQQLEQKLAVDGGSGGAN